MLWLSSYGISSPLVSVSVLKRIIRRVWRHQRSNHNPYIEDEQKTQWPKENSTKRQTTINKTYKYMFTPGFNGVRVT
jgi:hypothetical protein